MWRLALFLLFPALEIYLLIKVGGMIGAFTMLLWIFGSAVFGIWYSRVHSEYSLMQMRADLAQGKAPQHTLMDSVLISVGAFLLILPGLITDALGLLLLFPPTRRLMGKSAGDFFRSRAGGATTILYTNSQGFPRREEQDGQGPVFDAAASPPAEEESPRQATVIESKAIVIGTAENDENGKDNASENSRDK